MERKHKDCDRHWSIARHRRGPRPGVSGARLQRCRNVAERDEIEGVLRFAHPALIDGDIGRVETAQNVAEAALNNFSSIDAVIANAGIFSAKRFTDYTPEDLGVFVSTGLAGFIYITQLAVRQMQVQKSSGSVVAITAALVENPIAGVPVFSLSRRNQCEALIP